MHLDTAVDDLAQLLFAHQEVDLQIKQVLRIGTVHKPQILRNRLVENDPAHGGFDQREMVSSPSSMVRRTLILACRLIALAS